MATCTRLIMMMVTVVIMWMVIEDDAEHGGDLDSRRLRCDQGPRAAAFCGQRGRYASVIVGKMRSHRTIANGTITNDDHTLQNDWQLQA